MNNETENLQKKQSEEKKPIEEQKEIDGFIGDVVVKKIIEKFITDVVYKKYIDEIYLHENEHCFEYMKLQLKPLMENNFLSHELEDNLDNNNAQKEKIFFYDSDYNQNLNTWTEVQEPPSSHVDRHAASQVKVLKPILTDEHDEHNDTSSMVMTSEGGKIQGHCYQKSSEAH